MGIPNQYVQRVNGFFIEVIPVNSFAGPSSSGNLVALNVSGYVDPSLVYSIAGGSVFSLNGITGNVIVSGGQNVFITSSGQIILISASGGGGGGSDLATRPCSFIPGQPSPGQEVMAYTAETSETFPANFASPPSYGTCRVPPASGAQVYNVFKNASNVGTISISTAGIFTFATTGGAQITLNANDRFSVVAPSVIDPAIQGVSFTLVGTRIPIPAGIAPPIFTWRGAYNGSTTYNSFDVVGYLGSSYVCIAVSTGNLPTNTSFWNLVAQAGAAGATFGVQSVNGITGAVIISGGNNVSVAQTGQTVVISASGGGGGGGSAFPWTIVQQRRYTIPAAANSITCTFPKATAGSGNTAFILIACGGPSVPVGWTSDINIVQTNARLMLIHKATAGETSVTFTTGSADGYDVLFFEIAGVHALDASATGLISGTFNGSATPAAITASAGSVVFCALCSLTSGGVNIANAMIDPQWRLIAPFGGNFNGSRYLTGHMSVIGAVGGSITPPPIDVLASAFGSGGTAYASFSIL